MKLVITYCTLLKFNELYFFSQNTSSTVIPKMNKIIHTRASPTFSTSLTKFVYLHNMNQDYLLAN